VAIDMINLTTQDGHRGPREVDPDTDPSIFTERL
jgi:hypothetical protein